MSQLSLPFEGPNPLLNQITSQGKSNFVARDMVRFPPGSSVALPSLQGARPTIISPAWSLWPKRAQWPQVILPSTHCVCVHSSSASREVLCYWGWLVIECLASSVCKRYFFGSFKQSKPLIERDQFSGNPKYSTHSQVFVVERKWVFKARGRLSGGVGRIE